MKMATPLTVFLYKAAEDEVISPIHISLFTAIIHCWASGGSMNPIVVTRKKLMNVSKIRSTSTYHKCIKDLTHAGYINYLPSFSPSGSQIFLNK